VTLRILMVALLGLLTCTVSLFATQGMCQYGYGAKSKGMAGIAAAFPQDSFVVATNPAGASQLGNRLDLGCDYVIQNGGSREVDLDGAIVDGREYHSDRGLVFPSLGCLYRLAPCQSVGCAAFVAGAVATKWPVPLNGLGVTSATSLTSYTLFFTPFWACKLTSVHAIGVAVNLVVATMQINGTEGLAGRSLIPAQLSNRGIDTATGLNIHLGWLLRLHREFQVGIAWQTKSWMRKFERYEGFWADTGAVRWPARIDLGATWWALRQLIFSGDFTVLYWSGVKPMRNGSRETGLFGEENGPGLGWRAKPIAKLGLQWCATSSLAIRAGLSYGEQPMNETDTFLNQLVLSTQQAHMTIGATWHRSGRELNLFYAYIPRGHLFGFGSDPSGGTDNFDLRNTQHELGASLSRTF
jgi:long-chain fatty acid transport protein